MPAVESRAADRLRAGGDGSAADPLAWRPWGFDRRSWPRQIEEPSERFSVAGRPALRNRPAGPSPPDVTESAVAAPSPPAPLRILLAEDNAVNRQLALLLLERLGYRADVAGNGAELCRILEAEGLDVAVAVTVARRSTCWPSPRSTSCSSTS